MYDEVNYAITRLPGTVVRLGKRPVTIMEISSTGLVVFCYLDGAGKVESCKLNDLDINPVPLGYVNKPDNSYYAVRMPMRNDWKQGLRDVNIRTSDGAKILNYVNWKHIAKTIQGEFTPYKGCLNMVQKGTAVKQAFGRNFALVQNELEPETPYLFFKGVKKVGMVLNKKPALEDKFHWLGEMLELEFQNAN
jgi:hypothetical protein